jgi:phytoene dehydrogenase-like protein
VPVGGMGSLVDNLVSVAKQSGRVTFATRANVTGIDAGKDRNSISFDLDGVTQEVDARFVLSNASQQVLSKLLGEEPNETPYIEGAGFKMNLLLKRLPKLRSKRFEATEAFAGNVHIDEGYEQMITSYEESMAGKIPEKPPGEIYCHTLTDNSILSDELNDRGFQTITLFGLDLPYGLFENDNDRIRKEVVGKYLAAINQYLEEPIEDCLATDANGNPCIDAMSAVDLENKVHLPKGNIFHGDLTWPFADSEEEVGQWGVETDHPLILICGSAARRGGAVSGILGHNAAMKVMELVS